MLSNFGSVPVLWRVGTAQSGKARRRSMMSRDVKTSCNALPSLRTPTEFATDLRSYLYFFFGINKGPSLTISRLLSFILVCTLSRVLPGQWQPK